MRVFVQLPTQPPLSVMISSKATLKDILALFKRENLNPETLIGVLGRRILSFTRSLEMQGIKDNDKIEFVPASQRSTIELRNEIGCIFGEAGRLSDLRWNTLEHLSNRTAIYQRILDDFESGLEDCTVIDDLELPIETNTESANQINCEPLPCLLEDDEPVEDFGTIETADAFSSLEEAAHYAKKFVCNDWAW